MKEQRTGLDMSWKRIILLAILCGIIPGLLMIFPELEGTSFQEPGIGFEFWIMMAMLIILNCGTPLEAGVKTFVFFLISQPLIYLVQVPFSWQHWNLFSYYPKWGILTALTFPGAMIAWYTKKGNWMSVAILSVANMLLCVTLMPFISDIAVHFPHHLISIIFVVSELVGFVVILLKERKMRVAAFGIMAVLLLAAAWLTWCR